MAIAATMMRRRKRAKPPSSNETRFGGAKKIPFAQFGRCVRAFTSMTRANTTGTARMTTASVTFASLGGVQPRVEERPQQDMREKPKDYGQHRSPECDAAIDLSAIARSRR